MRPPAAIEQRSCLAQTDLHAILRVMSQSAVNLADPDCEPSDEDFAGLMERAFANVRAENEQRLARLREQIAAQRAEAMRQLGLAR